MNAENGIITGHLDKNAVETVRISRKHLSGLDLIVLQEYSQTGRGFAIPVEMADDFIAMFQAAKAIELPKPVRAMPAMRVNINNKRTPKRKPAKVESVTPEVR